MAIKVISVGKDHEEWVKNGIERYSKRLRPPFDVEWVLIAHSKFEYDKARQEESKLICEKINPTDYVILLDETGVNYDSPTLSQKFNKLFTSSLNVVVVIGGAYGVDEVLKKRANLTWSLSNLVFPHQLVRLILLEQIYRSQEISLGGKYHHQ